MSRQTGQVVANQNLPVDDYAQLLVSFGLPEPTAQTYADGERAVAGGELFVDTGDLSKLTGRPSTSLADAVATALQPVNDLTHHTKVVNSDARGLMFLRGWFSIED